MTARGWIYRSSRWMFLNRRTGRMAIAQWPNIWLWVFIVSTVALHILQPRGGVGAAMRVVADLALIVWAADEVLRGVNPFRRMLGSAVLLTTILGLTVFAR